MMGLNYRDDPDLTMLAFAHNEDLAVLVKYLTTDKDGETRYAQELLNDRKFREAGTDYASAWESMAAELQHFGGDTVVNALRRQGVLYHEILEDVCKKLDVSVKPRNPLSDLLGGNVGNLNLGGQFATEMPTTEVLETRLIKKLISMSWEKMSEAEREEFLSEVGLSPEALMKAGGIAAIFSLATAGSLLEIRLFWIMANAVAKLLTGQGLRILVGAGVMRPVGAFLGPIGWAVTALLTIPAITGPAYRVTIPSVIQMAYMRRAIKKQDRY